MCGVAEFLDAKALAGTRKIMVASTDASTNGDKDFI
jgi:hypothetical protein